MGFSRVFSWIFRDSHGFQGFSWVLKLVFMGSHGVPTGILMGFHGFSWVLVGSHGYSHVFSCVFMDTNNGFSWGLIGSHRYGVSHGFSFYSHGDSRFSHTARREICTPWTMNTTIVHCFNNRCREGNTLKCTLSTTIHTCSETNIPIV